MKFSMILQLSLLSFGTLSATGLASQLQRVEPSYRILGHSPLKSNNLPKTKGTNFTPYVYFGEVLLPDITCDEWLAEFDRRFDGIDSDRVASLSITNCYNYPDNRRLTYEGIIEPWVEGDIDYLAQFIARRQDFPVRDTRLQFRRASGVIFDFEVKYLDENGRELQQLGIQNMTLGAANSHTIAFDFDAARAAINGTVDGDLLPFIAHLFGDKERILAERLYLPTTSTIVFKSALRFLFEDLSAHKMGYLGSSKDIN